MNLTRVQNKELRNMTFHQKQYFKNNSKQKAVGIIVNAMQNWEDMLHSASWKHRDTEAHF